MSKHNPMPGTDIPPDTLAQAAAYDYEEAKASAGWDAEEAKRAAAEKAGEAVGGLRSTGATLGDTAAAAAARAAEAKERAAQTAADLAASSKGAATDVGRQLEAGAEEAAARASAAAGAASEKAQEAQAGGAGWSWEGAKAWGRERWGAWRVLPHEWWGSTQQAAEDLQQRLSWESFEAWQERHWAAFEERQRARLASLTDEQRAKWRHRLDEGEELVKREIGAFERWQQDWWARHHKEEVGAAAGAHGGRGKPTCPQCTLTYLFLPLLPHIGDSVSQCGLRLKHAIVGEMRDTGTKIADTLTAAGEKLGMGGKKEA